MGDTIFDSIRVLDLSKGMAGPIAGMVLADFGADVVKVEPPGGDWARAYAGFAMWNRGKHSIILDLGDPQDRAQAVDLAANCDVVIDDFSPDVIPVGLDDASLRDRSPGLVHCSVSGFGLASAGLTNLRAYDGVVSAKSGRFNGLDEVSGAVVPDARQRPVFVAAPIGTFGAAMLAVQGIAGGLVLRERSGRGVHVTTSVLDGLITGTMRLAYTREGDRVVPARSRPGVSELRAKGVYLTFMTAECSDGRFIQMCARQDHHFRNWLKATGLEECLAEPRYARVPMHFESMEDLEELEGRLRQAMRTRSQAEWMAIFSHDYDIGADPFLTALEFLDHPQLVENGRIVELDDPERGRVRQLGPIATFSRTPARITRSAPPLGAHAPEIFAARAPTTARTRPEPDGADAPGTPGLPFAGVTILEFASYLAAPLGGTLLAENGARVIKVEPLAGDPYRRVGLEAAHILHGKESLAVDLKSEQGRQILDQLIERADVLLHNYRPGVPERLGIGFERATALNPKLIYMYAASYGSKGPESHRPAFHSTPNALSGGGVLQAGRGNPPVDDSYPDPCAGMAVAATIAMAILARERDGSGQYVETSMLVSGGYVHSNEVLDHESRHDRLSVDKSQRGFAALYRLYPCRSGWLFIAAPREEEWAALARALDRDTWLLDPRYATAAERARHDESLTAEIGSVLAGRSAAEWEMSLTGAGVAAVRADAMRFEEFLVACNLVKPAEDCTFGEYFRLPPRIRFDGIESRLDPACAIGEHTLEILSELGYEPEDQHELLKAHIVGCPRDAEPTAKRNSE